MRVEISSEINFQFSWVCLISWWIFGVFRLGQVFLEKLQVFHYCCCGCQVDHKLCRKFLIQCRLGRVWWKFISIKKSWLVGSEWCDMMSANLTFLWADNVAIQLERFSHYYSVHFTTIFIRTKIIDYKLQTMIFHEIEKY